MTTAFDSGSDLKSSWWIPENYLLNRLHGKIVDKGSLLIFPRFFATYLLK